MSDVRLEDLELGPKALQLVLSLGVETLAELLALPAITASQRVVAELTEAFAELDVHYKGQLVALPGPEVHVLPHDASVDERLSAIDAWAGAKGLQLWQPAAKKAAITKAEKALGRKLPADYRQFLLTHDGQRQLAPMVAHATLLPIAQVVERSGQLAQLDAHPGIPIGASALGRDFLCIDRDEAIVTFYIDDDGHERIADSFSGLLALYYEQLQSGEIEID
jgi:cell wall assembly regulator SMI1